MQPLDNGARPAPGRHRPAPFQAAQTRNRAVARCIAVESQKAAAPFRPPLGGAAATEARNLRDTMTDATIRLHIERLAGGGFLATSPDVLGLVAEGRSVAEATEIAQGLARKIAESCIEHGDPLPPALTRLQEPETGLDLLVPVSVP